MRTIRLLLPILVIALLGIACSGAASDARLSAVGNAVGGTGYSGAVPEAVASAAPAAPGDLTGDTSASIGAIGARDDAKIVRTGSIDLQVSDVPKALRAARDGIVGMGGYVGASLGVYRGGGIAGSIGMFETDVGCQPAPSQRITVLSSCNAKP